MDTTLRDGAQGDVVAFGVEQKLRVTQRLDEFGIDIIEAGWPGSNPDDEEFFRQARGLKLSHSRLAAFGPVRALKQSLAGDPQIRALDASGAAVISLFANFWELGHAERDLPARIRETVAHFKAQGREVVFAASHFFDCYAEKRDLCVGALHTARDAGADALILCDTLGGAVTSRLAAVCTDVREAIGGTLGIHTHNDAGLAVANVLAAVEAGLTLVQGAINGYGERCGVADLGAVIANLELKLGYETVGPERLRQLCDVSHLVAAMADLPVRPDQPYAGRAAFTHKGGELLAEVMGVFAPSTHAPAAAVGNESRHMLSLLSGTGDILHRIDDLGLDDQLTLQSRRELADRIKQLEMEGYDLEAADGTLELLAREAANPDAMLFTVSNYEVSTRGSGGFGEMTSASVSLDIHGAALAATADGNGPIHALDRALRRCLHNVYPDVGKMELINYSLRVLEPQRGSAARGRVLIEWRTPEGHWSTLGVSENIITASWRALVDAMRLVLLRRAAHDPNFTPSSDNSWAV